MGELLGERPGEAPGQAGWLAAETTRLLEFAEGSWDPLGGFGRQDENGMRVPGASAELWITGRMTHVYALATMLGHPCGPELLRHGLRALGNRLRDFTNGGWYPEVNSSGPVRGEKEFYQHAFVVLAASSATIAGHPHAPELLDYALRVVDERFWSGSAGMVVEGWDEEFSEAESYRGVNATMHGVEAFLAAFDATGEEVWRDRALEMTARVVKEFAAPNDWRIPEHFDIHWNPLPEYNRDRPDDPFRPYGSTIGHGLEWSRLCLHLVAALELGDTGRAPGPNGATRASGPNRTDLTSGASRAGTATAGSVGGARPAWLLDGAQRLFERAVGDGWAVDGADGFVYTVDWHGEPVVHQRMHWVLAEAIGAAATLYATTGEDRYRAWYDTWWRYAEQYLLDRKLGSWHHELDRHNQPAATVWPGKVDAYHVVQATLLPRVPLRPSMASGVRAARAELTSPDGR